MDFAMLVEVFDRNIVTFVSITQSFNTTTSMGRLPSPKRSRSGLSAARRAWPISHRLFWRGSSPTAGHARSRSRSSSPQPSVRGLNKRRWCSRTDPANEGWRRWCQMPAGLRAPAPRRRGRMGEATRRRATCHGKDQARLQPSGRQKLRERNHAVDLPGLCLSGGLDAWIAGADRWTEATWRSLEQQIGLPLKEERGAR
jgi:hypothetical protein